MAKDLQRLIQELGLKRPYIVFAEGLRVSGCRHVNTGLIPGAVHYIVEDQPAEVAELIERYAAMQPE